MSYSALKRQVDSRFCKACKSGFPEWAQIFVKNKLSRGAFCWNHSRDSRVSRLARRVAYRKSVRELLVALDLLTAYASNK